MNNTSSNSKLIAIAVAMVKANEAKRTAAVAAGKAVDNVAGDDARETKFFRATREEIAAARDLESDTKSMIEWMHGGSGRFGALRQAVGEVGVESPGVINRIISQEELAASWKEQYGMSAIYSVGVSGVDRSTPVNAVEKRFSSGKAFRAWACRNELCVSNEDVDAVDNFIRGGSRKFTVVVAYNSYVAAVGC